MSVNGSSSFGQHDDVVVRKAEHGWVVGDENVSDLTSAMVLADLFAADQADSDGTSVTQAADEHGAPPRAGHATAPAPRPNEPEPDEAARLAVTITQLEHALAARVLVEQAIGVLAERHKLRPREAFDLLRKASRSRGTRVTELAQDVVASTANPLLRLPDELSRATPEPRQRGRLQRRNPGRHAGP